MDGIPQTTKNDRAVVHGYINSQIMGKNKATLSYLIKVKEREGDGFKIKM